LTTRAGPPTRVGLPGTARAVPAGAPLAPAPEPPTRERAEAEPTGSRRVGPVRLVAHGVSYAVGGHPILHDVDLSLASGELVALVGPNGAGKSTLCALLAGDLQPTAGGVDLDGRSLARWSRTALARERAVLVQGGAASADFAVLDVVLMGRNPHLGRLAGPGPDDVARARTALAEVGAGHLEARAFPTLSGGEQARVQLARVLTQEPSVLLLDEPTASLDLRHQHLVSAIARQRADAGAAVLAVVHDVALAAAYADRVVALDAGRVVADGPAARVLTAERLTGLYGHPVAVTPHPTQAWAVPVPERLDGTRS
jgi:iron complex transport system ATP-binding protein